MFEISKLFSFNWYDVNYTSEYNTDPLQVDNQRYAQPVQCGGGGYQIDKGKIQLTSDYAPTGKLFKADNTFVKNIALTAINPPILGVTFICYNGEVDFSDVTPGEYYAKITFTDSDAVLHEWRTTCLDVQIVHDGTQLIEATNDKNDKGVVFIKSDGSSLVITYRVASIIRLPLPKSDDEDFEDQYNTLVQESSIPYVTVTQLLGGPDLLPFDVIEKINLLYSLNNVKVDGQPFVKLSGSEFKPTRSDIGNMGALWEVELQPNNAYSSEQFITGTPGTGDLIVVRKTWPRLPFTHVSNSFIISGVFSIYSTLDYLQTINYGLQTFTLKLGTAAGLSDILQAEIGTPNPDASIDLIETHTFRRGLNVSTDIYCTVPAGVDILAFIIYDQLDSPVLNAPAILGNSQGRVSMWEDLGVHLGTPFFSRDWDITTGLGKVGSAYENKAMCDGRNNTQDRRKQFAYGWDYTDTSLPLGTAIGAQAITGAQTGNLLRSIEEIKPSLPAEGLFTLSTDVNSTNLDIPDDTHPVARSSSDGHPLSYEMHKGITAASIGLSSDMGDGEDLNIQNDAIVTLYYVEL